MAPLISDISGKVEDASERIRSLVRLTPVIRSEELSAGAGSDVFLKAENLQLTGSFKLRGALNKILILKESGHRSLVTASSGNHALAVARALRVTGMGGRIFLPRSVAPVKLARLRETSAHLELRGEDCIEAEEAARLWAERRSLPYVSPYNDLEIVAGQGTLALELASQIPDLATVIVAVGGGGLVSGVAAALKQLRPSLRVVACSPRNSCVMYESLQRGRIVRMASQETLSDGTAGAIEEDTLTFPLCQSLIDDFVLVTEAEIEQGIRFVLEQHRMVIEGAAGVAVAALRRLGTLNGSSVVVLCGGNLDRQLLLQICSSSPSRSSSR